MSLNLLLECDPTFLLSYIYDLTKFRTVKELIKINMSRSARAKFITPKHIKMMEEVATELLKNDRFQIQGTNGGYCLIKKNENIDGYILDNILGVTTVLAKTQFIEVLDINDIEQIKRVLLDKFTTLLQDNYITMMVMFDPISDFHPEALIQKTGFITRYGKIPLTDKKEEEE